MATASSDLTSYDSGYSAYSVSNLNNGCAAYDSTTYAQIYLTRGSGAVTEIFYNFSFNIPTTATNISVSAKCKALINTTSSSIVTTRQVQLFSGSTAMGSPSTLTNDATSPITMTTGNWSASQVNNAKIRAYAVRGTSNTTSSYRMRFYGATMTVTYTDATTGNKVYIKSGGTWKEASKIYVKVGGTWKEVSKAYKKVNGSWVEQSDKSAMFDPNAIYKKG